MYTQAQVKLGVTFISPTLSLAVAVLEYQMYPTILTRSKRIIGWFGHIPRPVLHLLPTKVRVSWFIVSSFDATIASSSRTIGAHPTVHPQYNGSISPYAAKSPAPLPLGTLSTRAVIPSGLAPHGRERLETPFPVSHVSRRLGHCDKKWFALADSMTQIV